jgi:hypothetical protein
LQHSPVSSLVSAPTSRLPWRESLDATSKTGH